MEGQMMVRWSGEVQVRVKSKKYSELDIGGNETFWTCCGLCLGGNGTKGLGTGLDNYDLITGSFN